MTKNWLRLLCLALLIQGLFFAGQAALVQAGNIDTNSGISSDINAQLQPIANIYDEGGDADQLTLVKTIARIIQLALSLLGIIFLVLIIYAGFLWLTSAGKEEQIEKAKKIMIAAIIGTAIILLAYMITLFVINTLLSATSTRT